MMLNNYYFIIFSIYIMYINLNKYKYNLNNNFKK